MNKLAFLSLFSLFVFSVALSGQDQWQALFNGKDFSNFQQLNGEATYRIEDEVMIGVSKTGTPNSFMATKKTYGDFILEFEVWVENGLNSGVQFRSLSKPDYRNGRVHGYQVEIETSDRRWAGGVFDEARRGWLYPLANNPKGQQAFVNGQWNHYRVEAIGNTIRTWVNGIQCANLVDDLTAEGFIAFQVHSIGNRKEREGKTVRWRNIRILTEGLEAARRTPDPEVEEISYLVNQLTENEKRKGWRLLWDGKTTQGWRSPKSDEFPEVGWSIQDGILTSSASGGAEAGSGGDIITEQTFRNFELQVDFKMTKGANSGIKYFVDPKLIQESGSAIGIEYQIIDDANHEHLADGNNRVHSMGALYDMVPPENLSEPSRSNKRINGGWNRARILVKDGHVEQWLNGVKLIDIDRHSQLFKALVQKSKYAKYENFGQIPEGHILLQDHGDEVAFRNVKIREF